MTSGATAEGVHSLFEVRWPCLMSDEVATRLRAWATRNCDEFSMADGEPGAPILLLLRRKSPMAALALARQLRALARSCGTSHAWPNKMPPGLLVRALEDGDHIQHAGPAAIAPSTAPPRPTQQRNPNGGQRSQISSKYFRVALRGPLLPEQVEAIKEYAEKHLARHWLVPSDDDSQRVVTLFGESPKGMTRHSCTRALAQALPKWAGAIKARSKKWCELAGPEEVPGGEEAHRLASLCEPDEHGTKKIQISAPLRPMVVPLRDRSRDEDQ